MTSPEPLPYGLRPVELQRDAWGAVCQDCGAMFTPDAAIYWTWQKSAGMHRIGTGHRTALFAVDLAECSACGRQLARDPRGDVLDTSGRCDDCRP